MADKAVIDLWYRRLPRYLYVEDLIEGQRVLEIGCGLGVGCDFFVEKGARAVVGVDRDDQVLARARQRYGREGLDFVAWPGGKPLPLGDASIDFVAVPDGFDWLGVGDFLGELRRVLVPEGWLLLAAPSADRATGVPGISYYDLLDRLAPLFARVRMIGQSPFLAYSLVEYAEGAEEPELSLDTSLLEGQHEEVTHYVALAGPSDEVLRGVAIVQIPFSPLENRLIAAAQGPAARPLQSVPAPPPAPAPPADWERQLAEERQRVRALEEKAKALTERLARAAELATVVPIEPVAAPATVASAPPAPPSPAPSQPVFGPPELSELRADLRARDDRIAQLIGDCQGLEWRVQELEGRAAARERSWKGQLEDLEERLRSRETALDEAQEASDRHRLEMEELERLVAEQTSYLDELEVELHAAEERAESAQGSKADAVRAIDSAQREEHAARKRVAELEGLLLRPQAPPAEPPIAPEVVASLEAELGKLKERLALADSQMAVWMTKFRESERKAEEARGEATRKLLDSKSAAASQLQRTLEESTRKLASTSDEAMRAERDRLQAQQRFEEAQKQLAEAQQVRARGEEQLRALQGELVERDAQLERLAQVAVLERRAAEQLQVLSADLEAKEQQLRHQAEALRAAVAESAQAREEAAREALAARDRVAQAEQAAEGLRQQLQSSLAEAGVREQELRGQLGRLETELARAKDQAATLETERQGRAEQEGHRVAVLEAAARDAQLQVQRLETEVAVTRRELGQAQKQLTTKQRALDKGSDDGQERKAETQELRRELKDRERKLEGAQSAIADRDEKLARMTKELAAAGKQLARLERVATGKGGSGVGKTAVKDEAQGEVLARLREEVKFRKADLEETTSALAKARGRAEELQLELARREAEQERRDATHAKTGSRLRAESELRERAVEEARRAGERAQLAKAEAEAARTELSRARALTEQAQDRVRRLELEREEQRERIKALKRERDGEQRRAEREAEQAKRQQAELAERAQVAAEASGEAAALRRQVAELGAQAAERSAKAGDLQTQLVEREESLRRTGAELAEARRELEARVSAVEQLSREREQWDRSKKGKNGEEARRLGEIGGRLQAFEAGLHLEGERLAAIEDVLEEAVTLANRRPAVEPLQRRVGELEQKLEQREQELQEQLLEIDRLRSDENTITLVAPESNLSAELGQKEGEILVLQSHMAGWRRRAQKLREELSAYRGRVATLTAEEIAGMLEELAADVEELGK